MVYRTYVMPWLAGNPAHPADTITAVWWLVAAALAFHVGLHLVAGHGFLGHATVVLILLVRYATLWLPPQPQLAPA